MEFRATAKYLRISPRKLDLLARSLKPLRPKEALTKLALTRKRGATHLQKLIAAAVADAKLRNNVHVDALVFKQIEIMPGSAMKRFRAVSRGMAHAYKKRMSHVNIVLDTLEEKKTINIRDSKKVEAESSTTSQRK